jgi:drug/metabolite transporter (DMT)-like permease
MAAPLYVLLAIFLWSSLGVVVRLSGVEIHILIFYSIIVSLIFQGLILTRKKYRRELPDIRRLKYPVILGFVSLSNTFAFYYAFKNTTIANAVLTHYTAPVIVAFLSPLFLKERITWKIIVVIILSSVGLLIMLDGFSLKEGQTMGIIAGLLSGISYAIIVIFLRLHSQKFDPLILAFFSNMTIAILLLPFIREFPFHAWWGIHELFTDCWPFRHDQA